MNSWDGGYFYFYCVLHCLKLWLVRVYCFILQQLWMNSFFKILLDVIKFNVTIEKFAVTLLSFNNLTLVELSFWNEDTCSFLTKQYHLCRIYKISVRNNTTSLFYSRFLHWLHPFQLINNNFSLSIYYLVLPTIWTNHTISFLFKLVIL